MPRSGGARRGAPRRCQHPSGWARAPTSQRACCARPHWTKRLASTPTGSAARAMPERRVASRRSSGRNGGVGESFLQLAATGGAFDAAPEASQIAETARAIPQARLRCARRDTDPARARRSSTPTSVGVRARRRPPRARARDRSASRAGRRDRRAETLRRGFQAPVDHPRRRGDLDAEAAEPGGELHRLFEPARERKAGTVPSRRGTRLAE